MRQQVFISDRTVPGLSRTLGHCRSARLAGAQSLSKRFENPNGCWAGCHVVDNNVDSHGPSVSGTRTTPLPSKVWAEPWRTYTVLQSLSGSVSQGITGWLQGTSVSQTGVGHLHIIGNGQNPKVFALYKTQPFVDLMRRPTTG